MRPGFFQKLFPLRRKQFFAWQIEITTRCPLSCRMCIRQGLSEWASADMSLNNFEKLIPYFHDVETIILQGWGEPLLHNDLCAMIRAAKGGTESTRGSHRHAKAQSPSVGFVTSGKGLNDHYSAELIDAGIDFIGFSFAGSTAKTHEGIRLNSDFQELVHAVGAFNELKKKRGVPGLRTHIVYLMLKDNLQDIPALPRLARDIGIQEIVLTNVIHVTNSWQDAQRIFTCEGRSGISERCRRRGPETGHLPETPGPGTHRGACVRGESIIKSVYFDNGRGFTVCFSAPADITPIHQDLLRPKASGRTGLFRECFFGTI
jgi:MoaA/NifB/PqqE/SkfB family radical SAM enzyme